MIGRSFSNREEGEMSEENARAINALKVELVLKEDGILTLQGLPFHAGDAVEVII
jgi:hypothetical protein